MYNILKATTCFSKIILFTDFLRRIVRIVQLVKGVPCEIQAADSKVILHVPEGVNGAILANIHTNVFNFNKYIPENDCLIAPICEYHLEPFVEEQLYLGDRNSDSQLSSSIEPSSPISKYKIEIPHIVRDIEKVRPHLKVRHGDLHSGILVTDDDRQDDHSEKVQYHIDDKYVTILTSHFSGYIITAEGMKCCGETANLLFFGSLRNRPYTRPPAMATVKVFISNRLEDYQNVSIFLFIATS